MKKLKTHWVSYELNKKLLILKKGNYFNMNNDEKITCWKDTQPNKMGIWTSPCIKRRGWG